MRASRTIPLLITFGLLAGCSSSSDDDGNGSSGQQYGVFLDAPVSGLTYTTASGNGITDDDGRFPYLAGETVSFSLGAVQLGDTAAKTIVTPLDLAEGAADATTYALNLTRFLLALDEDQDNDDGIQIATGIATLASTWPVIDFGATTALDSVGATLIDAVNQVYGATITLPTAAAAQTHLEQQLTCNYGGSFVGTLSGDDSTQMITAIDPVSGVMRAIVAATLGSGVVNLNGELNAQLTYTLNDVDGDFSMTGLTTSDDEGVIYQGTWSYDNQLSSGNGTFELSPLTLTAPGSDTAEGVYYGAGDLGPIAMSFSSDGSVSAQTYSALGNLNDPATSGTRYNLTGTLSNGSLSLSSSDGLASFSGTVLGANNRISGTWQIDGDGGSFSVCAPAEAGSAGNFG